MDSSKKFSSPSSFPRENGEFEEVIVLPSHSRLSPPEGEEQQQQQQEGEEEGERVPVVAFRENGLLKPLSGIEDISAQQGPGHCVSHLSPSLLYSLDRVTEDAAHYV